MYSITLISIELLSGILDIAKWEDKLSYIWGDFDINVLKLNVLNCDTHSDTAQLMDMCEKAFFRSLIALYGSRPQLQICLIIFYKKYLHMSLFYKGFFVTDASDYFPGSIPIICVKENTESYTCKDNYSFRKKNIFVAVAVINMK